MNRVVLMGLAVVFLCQNLRRSKDRFGFSSGLWRFSICYTQSPPDAGVKCVTQILFALELQDRCVVAKRQKRWCVLSWNVVDKNVEEGRGEEWPSAGAPPALYFSGRSACLLPDRKISV
ncbi:hypothetical protein TNCV_969501 [Trichonephila clavipes]|nr:hypothetical protein TNCV_969501 [Trichonephila clavipes]